MTIKLIATDMDGTLLDDKGLLDKERFGRVLDKLEERQIPFVVASGNHISRLEALFAGFEDRLTFVADNGASIYKGGKLLYRHRFSIEQVAEVVSFYGATAGDVCLMLSNDETIFMPQDAGQPFDETLAIEPDQLKAFLDKIQPVAHLGEVAQSQTIYKIGLWVSQERVETVVSMFNQAFAGQLTAVTSGYGSIDILPVGIHKASGLSQVIEPLGISFDHVMAFGDSDNDLEMLEVAGFAYAMENATDKVKDAAKHLAPSHAEGGVFTVIEEYLNRG